MVKDGLATTNPDLGPSIYDDLLGIRSGSHAMAIDTSASLGTIKQVLSRRQRPQHRPRGGADARARGQPAKGGVFVQGGELFIVNKSAPEKQAAAWKFEKFLDQTDSMTTWAIGTGYIPIRTSSADSPDMTQYWAANPGFKVAYDQLLNGPTNLATSGSVIGANKPVRDAVRDADEHHVHRRQGPQGGADGPRRRTPPPRSTTTTPASAADRGSGHAVVEALGGIQCRGGRDGHRARGGDGRARGGRRRTAPRVPSRR